MYYNPEDTPLYISEYSLLAFGDKHLLHMLIYWDFTTLTVYQDKWKLNRINLYCMLGYIRIYSGYKSLQKNSYCAFWYFKTFTAYWDLSVLFVYICTCIKTSNVYCHLEYFRTYSVCFVQYTAVSVLYKNFPIMLGYITRTSSVYWDLSELTLCIGLYPDGGRGTSFITALEDSTEWLPLDFLLLEELGRESACLLQNHEVYGTWTLKTFFDLYLQFKKSW